jgi:hypothetical protein
LPRAFSKTLHAAVSGTLVIVTESRAGKPEVGQTTKYKGFNCSGDSTGIRLMSNNKLIRQSLSQIAKTERTISEVAANLAMEEHQGQGERQNPNHGEHDQRLAAPLMHGWFFEVAVGSDGLKHFRVDDPTTAA